MESTKDIVEDREEAKICLIRDEKTSNLYKTLKKLDKNVINAIEFLSSVVVDEKAPMKDRIDCAKTILEKKIQVSDSINKDQLSRLVTQMKISLAVQPKKTMRDVEGESAELPPDYCPDMILDVSKIN